MKKKFKKICIIMYLLLQVTLTKSYKLNTTIIFIKMTNNNEKRDSGTIVFF